MSFPIKRTDQFGLSSNNRCVLPEKVVSQEEEDSKEEAVAAKRSEEQKPSKRDKAIKTIERMLAFHASRLEKDVQELDRIRQKIKYFSARSIPIGSELTEAEVEEIGEISDPLIRQYVVLCYNDLAKREGALEALASAGDIDDQYTYDSDTRLVLDKKFELLQRFSDEFMEKQSLGRYHFGTVIQYVQYLAKGRRIESLALPLLTTRQEWLEEACDYHREEIKRLLDERDCAIQLAGKSAKDFPRGNFDFIIEMEIKKSMSRAFQQMDRVGLWYIFDYQLPKNDSWHAYCQRWPKFVQEVMPLLEDRIDVWVINGLAAIHKQGWESYVQDCLK